MIHHELGACLRRLYGGDAIDRLEAAPTFDDILARLDDTPPASAPCDLVYEADDAEQARFEAECARDLRGDLDE